MVSDSGGGGCCCYRDGGAGLDGCRDGGRRFYKHDIGGGGHGRGRRRLEEEKTYCLPLFSKYVPTNYSFWNDLTIYVTFSGVYLLLHHCLYRVANNANIGCINDTV